ncbi:base excision DNA repair protein [Zalerion maritima]|uniref:Base excision DNA repair protein n=1 Tax=Zalerion maritima TaxID=339359 RepID=A0AAD5RIR4_9PEZI|nr:base excision DNA repair protein [Zalerion maritima]
MRSHRHGLRVMKPFLYNASDDEAIREVIGSKGLGPKYAYCLLSTCLNRSTFVIDAHIYRILRLWGWTPKETSTQNAQPYLDVRDTERAEVCIALPDDWSWADVPCFAAGIENAPAPCEFRTLYNKSQD